MHASHVAKIPTALALAFASSCIACGGGAPRAHYDVVIAGGTVHDGSGAPGVKADVGWVGDEIKAVGDLHDADATTVVRPDGLAVALADKRATPEQLQTIRDLVDREMREGALGIASALIYAPGFYATTDELIEISKVAARHHGIYISHMRSEGNRLVEAVDELIRISREAGLPAEIYHLKAAGQANWPKMDRVIEMVEAARKDGHRITADMYTY